MADQGKIISIRVDQLELDLSNPRHKPFKWPAQAIEFLVSKEKAVDLAIDIAKEGTNPMDLLGVFKKSGSGKNATYVAAEGNRRVCALMLLHDPEKIPPGVVGRAKMIGRLENAAKPAHLSSSISAVLFNSKKSAKPWVDRMHIQDGRSRRRWTPDQQERAMGGGRNQDAVALLDAALAKRMVTETDRASKLTTVQRYLSNPTMRRALGVVRDKDRSYWINRDIKDFALLLEAFLEDVRHEGGLSSRSDAAAVIRYSDQLLDQAGVGDDRVDPIPLSDAFDEVVKLGTKSVSENEDEEGSGQEDDNDTDSDDEESDHVPIKPRTTIGGNRELETALATNGNQKLQSLYKSCSTLSLKQHCPIITVGFWSLMESLAALHAGEGKAFYSYFSYNRLQSKFGFSCKNECKNITSSLKRLTERGNSTKHSAIAASFDGNQVANDFDVLTPLMLAVLHDLPT